MGVELVEEVHDGVGVECGAADDHMLLGLCPVTAVRPTQLLPFHPSESQLFELQKVKEGT